LEKGLIPFDLRLGKASEIITILESTVPLDSLRPLANIRIHARIGERDAPVVNVAIEELQVLASGLQGEIVRDTLVVVQEIVLHDIGAIAQAKNEVFVSEVRICFITCHRIGR